MTGDLAFSFSDLSAAAQRHIRIFQMHQFLDRFAMGLTVAVVALALLDRGLDLLEIAALFSFYSLTTLTLELPFGGLADAIGRKPVFLMASCASLLSLVLFVASPEFSVLALSFIFIGFGRALRSGTLDAWFVERFHGYAPGVDVQPALARAQTANALGLAIGAVMGGVLPDLFGDFGLQIGWSRYDLSYVASFVLMSVVFLFTWLVISEEGFEARPGALKAGFLRVPEVLKSAVRLTFAQPSVLMLFVVLALFLMATNPVEVLWPTHFREMLGEAFASTVIGVLTATYFFAIALGAALSPHLNRLLRRRYGLSLAVSLACVAVFQCVLALQGDLWGFAFAFVLMSVALGLCETPASAILHGCVADHQRSTMLSLRSLIQQAGAALGLVAAGALADLYSTPVAWMAGSAVLCVACVICLMLARRLVRRD